MSNNEQQTISAMMVDSPNASRPFPTLAVDGLALETWLSAWLDEETLRGLVPAQGWLIDDAELALAWRRIEPTQSGASAIVPLLVCESDVDLSCTVLAVEQLSTEHSVIWLRFGMALDHDVATVRWFEQPMRASFDKSAFKWALVDLKSKIDHEWK